MCVVTSRTGAAVEGALGVEAGNGGVAGARWPGQLTLVHVGHTRRGPGGSLPAVLTEAAEVDLRTPNTPEDQP